MRFWCWRCHAICRIDRREAVADQWKYFRYRKNEGKFCQTGPYAFCRHPNYLGEILFWLGLYVAGVPAMLTKWSTFIPASIGCAFILFLMTMASKRGIRTLWRSTAMRLGIKSTERRVARSSLGFRMSVEKFSAR